MKTKLKPDNKDQSNRFIEKAAQVKADNDKERFEQACKTIINKTKKKKS